MPSSPPSDAPPPQIAALSPAAFRARLIGGIVLLNLFVCMLVGLSLHQSHRQYQGRAEITTRNLTQTLDSEIAGAIESVGVTLFAVKDEYERQSAAGSVARPAMNRYIARVHARLHYIDGLRIADEHGTVRYGDDVAPDSQASLTDRDHFTRQRDSADAGLVVSKPVNSRVNDKWVIVFTRRLDHPDGSFAGIVLASVTLDHLAEIFSALDVGPRGVVTLLDHELGIVARYSGLHSDGGAIGHKVASASLQQLVAAGDKSGTYLASSAVDGVERMFSYRRVAGYPLGIVVGLATADYLAAWRSEAARLAALAALFALITGAAAWLIYRSWKRQVGANAALARQEAKFRTVADFTFDWEYWRGPQTEILYMTPSCVRITGFTREQFIVDPDLLVRIVHPEDRHILERHLHAAGAMGCQDEAQVEFRIVRRDGDIRWLVHHCRAICGHNGESLGRRVSNRDITERKLAEQALLASRRNLAAAQALAHVGSWELDLAHNRLIWSEEMYRIFGMAPEHFGAAYETFLNALHPDDRERVDQAYLASLAQGGGRYDIEYRILRRSDGQLRWGYARCEHERDANGKVLRSLGTVQDITRRKQLENVVERERTRLQTILRMASDGIHIIDADGVLVEANPAFLDMLGHDEAAIGKLRVTDWALVSWADAKAHIDSLTTRRSHEVFETRHRRRDGAILDIEISAAGIEIEGKSYVCAASRDISARKQVEAELIAAKQAAESASLTKTRFLAAASHDLRQPLQAIGLFHESLLRTGLDEKQQKISHHISTSVHSLGELLNKLLDISRLDADMIRPQPAVIQPRDILGTVDAEFSSLAIRKRLRFNLFCPLDGLALYSDPNLLLDLLRNLIGNAVKYTERGGVLVAVRRRGERALIQVWDSGIGIAPEHLDAIYEEYFQVGNAERHRAKGVGLGLSIVRRLSGLLGTAVHCRSRVGRGSVFEISLPLASAAAQLDAAAPAAAPSQEDAAAGFAGKRVVIVEDDRLAGKAVRLALETYDLQVTVFATAEEALGSAAALAADYYISDFRLPGMDGLHLLDAMQQAAARPIKGVLLTGDTSPERVKQAQASGLTVVFKPIDLPRLLAAMAA